MGRKSLKNQRRNRMYWANSRRIAAVQRSYAGFGEREKVEEEAKEVGSVGQGSRLLSGEVI